MNFPPTLPVNIMLAAGMVAQAIVAMASIAMPDVYDIRLRGWHAACMREACGAHATAVVRMQQGPPPAILTILHKSICKKPLTTRTSSLMIRSPEGNPPPAMIGDSQMTTTQTDVKFREKAVTNVQRNAEAITIHVRGIVQPLIDRKSVV